MPENINDTPARYEENVEYLRDPLSNSAKPYSSKQSTANDEHRDRVWLYHKEHGGRIFSRHDVDQALEDGWSEKCFEHPNNPSHQTAKAVDTPELEALRGEAEKLGIKVDKRWTQKRLLEEMEKAA